MSDSIEDWLTSEENTGVALIRIPCPYCNGTGLLSAINDERICPECRGDYYLFVREDPYETDDEP